MTDLSKTRERIAELKQIEAAATPGPWRAEEEDIDDNGYLAPQIVGPLQGNGFEPLVAEIRIGLVTTEANTKLIPLARNSLAALLDIAEAAAEAIEALNHPERFSSVGAFAKLDAELGRLEENR